MYYLGQTVKLEWNEKGQDFNVGIVLYKNHVVPTNKKEADDYYGVLSYQGEKLEPVTFLFTGEKMEYLFDKKGKTYWGKTKTKRLALIGKSIKRSKTHENELNKLVKSNLIKLNEIDI